MQLGGEEEVRREMRGLTKVVRCRWVAPSRLEKRGRRAQGCKVWASSTQSWRVTDYEGVDLLRFARRLSQRSSRKLMALSHCCGTVLLYGNRGMVRSPP
jgi:hypothetical protein